MAKMESASRCGGRRDLLNNATAARLCPLRVLLWSYVSVPLVVAFWKRMRARLGEASKTRTSGCQTEPPDAALFEASCFCGGCQKELAFYLM